MFRGLGLGLGSGSTYVMSLELDSVVALEDDDGHRRRICDGKDFLGPPMFEGCRVSIGVASFSYSTHSLHARAQQMQNRERVSSQSLITI